MDKYIAKQIILAQIASDGGKNQKDVLERVLPLLSISKLYYKKRVLCKRPLHNRGYKSDPEKS